MSPAQASVAEWLSLQLYQTALAEVRVPTVPN